MVYSKAAVYTCKPLVYTCKPLLYKKKLKERCYLHSVQQSYGKNSCKPGIKYFTLVNCHFTVICQFTLVNCCFTVICQFTLVNCHFTVICWVTVVNCHFTVICWFKPLLYCNPPVYERPLAEDSNFFHWNVFRHEITFHGFRSLLGINLLYITK